MHHVAMQIFFRRVLIRAVHTIWQVIFVESSKMPSKLTFVVLNFVIATSPGAWHCTSDDVIDTRAHDLARYLRY